MRSIVIPVKSMSDSKLRLSDVISGHDRARLSRAMLEDVLDLTSQLAPVSIVTADPLAAKTALLRGCRVIEDPGIGLDAAIAAATAAAVRDGVSTLLVLPCDIPLIEGEELAVLLETSSEVALVASRDGGTNALLRKPPDRIATSFGPKSAARHIAAAQAQGVSPRVFDLPSIAFDVDTSDDLISLARSEGSGRSVELAASLVSRDAEVPAPSPS